MSQYLFVTNNGKQITLGEKSNLVKVRIHDSTPEAPTPTSLVIDYTAELFRKYGLNDVPTLEEYKDIPEAIDPGSILTTTEISDMEKDLFDRVLRRIRPSDGTGLTAYGKKVVASMRAAKKYAQRC